jgi:hypothetical protein
MARIFFKGDLLKVKCSQLEFNVVLSNHKLRGLKLSYDKQFNSWVVTTNETYIYCDEVDMKEPYFNVPEARYYELQKKNNCSFPLQF